MGFAKPYISREWVGIAAFCKEEIVSNKFLYDEEYSLATICNFEDDRFSKWRILFQKIFIFLMFFSFSIKFEEKTSS